MTLDNGLWNAFQGIGALVVAGPALADLKAAYKQIEAMQATREESASVARTQRTSELLAAFGTDDMEYRFGFFDAAYDIQDSREVFNGLYHDLVIATRRRLLSLHRAERIETVRSESMQYLEYQIDPNGEADQKIKRADRASAFKNEIISVANLCERAWALMQAHAIDDDLLLAEQAYNIASTYYIAQDALADLVREEHFNFDDFRSIALRARDHLKGKPYGVDVADQPFPPLPKYAPSR